MDSRGEGEMGREGESSTISPTTRLDAGIRNSTFLFMLKQILIVFRHGCHSPKVILLSSLSVTGNHPWCYRPMAQSVERSLPVWKVRSSNPSRVKPIVKYSDFLGI